MGSKTHHMGPALGKEEQDRFHKGGPALGPKQHEALRKRLGVTKAQDAEWHRTHLTLAEERAVGAGSKAVDPLIVGRSLVRWCVKQGWLVQRGKEYFATQEGVGELHECFDIQL